MTCISIDGTYTNINTLTAHDQASGIGLRGEQVELLYPLIVDLDGTLTPTDTLVESVIQMVKQSPFTIFRLPFWLLKGRANFKEMISANVVLDAKVLPYRHDLLDYLRVEKAKGRRLILATAAHTSIATGVASYLGLFEKILATNVQQNLKGKAKLEAIQRHVGVRFVYAGDSNADIPVWQSSQAAVLVGISPDLVAKVSRMVPIEKVFPKVHSDPALWLKALRVHQWVKNLLLFVPLLTAFSFTSIEPVVTMCLAFIAFSLAASATYIANDLWDLASDRLHPRKRFRPFASVRISILRGLGVAAVFLTMALALAFIVSKLFFLMLVLYVALTSAYSLILKEYVLIDVIILSILYTIRILAGSVAIGVSTSSWLLAFSVCVFLSLALVKRCSELVSLEQAGGASTRGRDYRVSDLTVLWPLGLSSAFSSVVIFGLFISAQDTQTRYATPALLWLVAIGLIYWLTRLWIKTARGEMHDDPVIYAIKDFGSRVTVFVMVVVVIVGHFLSLG